MNQFNLLKTSTDKSRQLNFSPNITAKIRSPTELSHHQINQSALDAANLSPEPDYLNQPAYTHNPEPQQTNQQPIPSFRGEQQRQKAASLPRHNRYPNEKLLLLKKQKLNDLIQLDAQVKYEKYRRHPADRNLLLFKMQFDEKGQSPKKKREKKEQVIVFNWEGELFEEHVY